MALVDLYGWALSIDFCAERRITDIPYLLCIGGSQNVGVASRDKVMDPMDAMPIPQKWSNINCFGILHLLTAFSKHLVPLLKCSQ